MESRRFEFPWSGEPKWTPYPPPPLTPIHISLPTLSKNTPSISPLSYTYIHSPPTLYPIQMPPFILYTGPAPYPPFSLFWTVFSHLPAISTLPHHFISIAIVYQSSPFTSWPIPSPCPCLPPAPIFAFLDAFLMFYCMYFFPILYIHVHISLLALNRENPTAILGCNQLPGQEQSIANFCRKKAPKKRPKIHIYPLIHTIYIPYGTYALGRPCGSLLHPPIGSSMGCTATRPRSGTEEP